MIINAYKPIGKTPLQVIEKIRQERPKFKNKKIGYAGRLDPMAEGVVILMVDEETKKRDRYQDLDKTYEFKIIFGVETDSLDILGLVTNQGEGKINKNKLENSIMNLKGDIEMPYPIYSSKPVKSKPLFWWARNKRIGEIEIPIKKTRILEANLLSINTLPSKSLHQKIIQSIDEVDGDFRQKQIKKSWQKYFGANTRRRHEIAQLKVKVTSGTYVRSLSKKIANEMGMFGTALSIKRTKVGNFRISDSQHFF